MSNGGPPKLRKSDLRKSDPEKRGKDGSLNLKKADAKIREKVGPKLKKADAKIREKVGPKLKKGKSGEQTKDYRPSLRKTEAENKEKTRLDSIKDKTPPILRKKSVLGIIGFILLIILIIAVAMLTAGDADNSTSNNTENITNTVNSSNNTYNNGIVTFNYPEGWTTANKTSDSSLMVTFQKDGNNSFSVFREDLGNYTFSDRVTIWRATLAKNGMIYYEGNLTVDGYNAYEFMANYKPQEDVYSTRGVIISQNDTVYFIIFIFDKPLLDYKEEMDLVINSFHINKLTTT